MPMTPRENLASLLCRTGYEYAPCQLDLCPTLWNEFKHRMDEAGTPDRRLEDYFGVKYFPTVGIPGPARKKTDPIDWTQFYTHVPLAKDASVDDTWGIGHEKGSAAAFHMTRMRHPMEQFNSVAQIEDYPWPDWSNESPETDEYMRKRVEEIHTEDRTAWAGMACTVWETAWYLRSMEQLMMDMIDDDPKATALLDRVTAAACDRARRYARAGVDVLHLGDDIGMQSSPMMAISLYREWLKPRLKQVIDAAKRENPNIIIDYHSCGYVLPFIDDLIEAGVQVLNPVQPESQTFEEVYDKWGNRLSFRGTLGTQTTMPFGTPEEVRAWVHKHLAIAGSKGGLFCVPTHILEPEVPWANVEAYVQACKDFRP